MTNKRRTTQRQQPPASLSPFTAAAPPDGYRVLLFSPTSSDLPGAHGEALAAIGYGDRVIAVQHPVTPAEALREIERTGGGNDVVWFFSTHTRLNGSDAWDSAIQMDDGILPATTLATYAKVHRPALIYLNSCQSREIAQLVCEYAGTDGIGTIIDTPDELAYMTGRLFLQQLFATGSLKAAYDLSRPANNRTYIYISGYRETAMPTQNTGGDHADLKYISDKIEGLDRAIRGDDYGTNGLIADFRQFKIDLLRYMEERKSWEYQMETWKAGVETWKTGVETRLLRSEGEQQDMAHWRNQQAQPRPVNFSIYLQILIVVAGIVLAQLLIAWGAANYFYR